MNTKPWKRILYLGFLATLICSCKPLRSDLSDEYSDSSKETTITVVTDTEGMREALQARIDDGSLQLSRNGPAEHLDFPPGDHSSHFLFAGDVSRRGPYGIWLMDLLANFKEKYPNRVHLLAGNHDDGRLGLIRDLDSHYSESNLKGLTRDFSISGPRDEFESGLVAYIKKWFSDYGLQDALDNHYVELSQTNKNINVTQDGAALDYFERVRPGGKFFQYLTLCQEVFVMNAVIAVHGGITEQNFGYVGGVSTRYADAKAWAAAMAERRRSDFETMTNTFLGQHRLDKIRSLYTLVYGDAKYDAETSTLVPRNESVIYPFRYTNDGSFRMWPKSVLDQLVEQGIRLGIVGHSPVPVPTMLKANGFRVVMADTSFADDKARLINKVTVTDAGNLKTEGRLSNGKLLKFDASEDSEDSPVGKIVSGYILVGKDESEKHVGYRYGESFKIETASFSSKDLAKLEASGDIIEPWNAISEEWSNYTRRLLSILEERGSSLIELNPGSLSGASNQTFDNFLALKNSRPIWVMGYYKTSFRDLDPQKLDDLDRTLDQLILDASENGNTFITGGTSAGVEGMIHRKIAEFNATSNGRKVEVIGAIHALKNPSDLDPLVTNFTLVSHDYGSALAALAPKIKSTGGEVAFLGASTRFPEQLRSVIASDIGRRYWDIDFEKRDDLHQELTSLGLDAGTENKKRLNQARERELASQKNIPHGQEGSNRVVIMLDIDETLGIGADIKFMAEPHVYQIQYEADDKAYSKYRERFLNRQSSGKSGPGEIHYELLPGGELKGYFVLRPGIEQLINTLSRLCERENIEVIVASINDPARIRKIMDTIPVDGRTLSDRGAKFVHRDVFSERATPTSYPTKNFSKLRDYMKMDKRDTLVAIDDRADEMVGQNENDIPLNIPKFTPEVAYRYLDSDKSVGPWLEQDPVTLKAIENIVTTIAEDGTGDLSSYCGKFKFSSHNKLRSKND